MNKSVRQPLDVSKNTEWVANSLDHNQIPHSVTSDLSLHCFLRFAPIFGTLFLTILGLKFKYIFFSSGWFGGGGGVWLGETKVSCILRHQGVQLILAYSWARPAVLAAGKGECFYFIHFFTFDSFSSFSAVPLFHLLYYNVPLLQCISSVSLLPFSGRRHKMTHKGWRVVKPHHNQKLMRLNIGSSWSGSRLFPLACLSEWWTWRSQGIDWSDWGICRLTWACV